MVGSLSHFPVQRPWASAWLPGRLPPRVRSGPLGCTARADALCLKYSARTGAQNVCSSVNIEGDRRYASEEELKQLRDLAGQCGVSFVKDQNVANTKRGHSRS
jgi:hypothetical protein